MKRTGAIVNRLVVQFVADNARCRCLWIVCAVSACSAFCLITSVFFSGIYFAGSALDSFGQSAICVAESLVVVETVYAENPPKKAGKKSVKPASKAATVAKAESKATATGLSASGSPENSASTPAVGDKAIVDGSEGQKEQSEKNKSSVVAKTGKPSSVESAVGLKTGEGNEPIYITSDTLTVESKKRIFTYTGSVKMVQGETNIDADVVVGKYDENNVIQEVICEGNVHMSKGPGMQATSNRAVYKLASRSVVLTEGPEITHQGSTLTADIIRVFMDEDRSEAEGNVKVKVMKTDGKDKKVQIR